MLVWSTALLLATIAGGAFLLSRTRKGWSLRLAHGGAGAAGLALLLLAAMRGQVHGAISIDAASLIATGFIIGLYLGWLAWRKHRPPSLALFLHATLGGSGALLLAGLVFR